MKVDDTQKFVVTITFIGGTPSDDDNEIIAQNLARAIQREREEVGLCPEYRDYFPWSIAVEPIQTVAEQLEEVKNLLSKMVDKRLEISEVNGMGFIRKADKNDEDK